MTDVGHLAEIADGFLDVVNAVGNEVTKEKVKAIGARNRLQTIAKEREAQVNIFSKAKLQKKSIFFLIHLFARDILLMKKLEIAENKTAYGVGHMSLNDFWRLP